MAFANIQPGLRGRHSFVVETNDLASAHGYPGMDVLSSMSLMTSLELACLYAVRDHLPADHQCVGGGIRMTHQAATPLGMTVVSQAELVEVDGPKLVFQVSASDGEETVSRATHVRYVVASQPFFQKVAQKAARVKNHDRQD